MWWPPIYAAILCHFLGYAFGSIARGRRGFADLPTIRPKSPDERWSRGGALQRVGELIKACAPQPRARRGRFASSPDQATMRTATLALLPAAALGHGALQLPPSWHNPGGVFSAFLNDPHQPGAGDQNAQGCTGKHAPGQLEAAQGCAAEWYTNYTFANPSQPGSSKGEGTGEPTIARSSPLRTYQDWNFVDNKACTYKDGPECTDWTAHNPWRAPVRSTPSYSYTPCPASQRFVYCWSKRALDCSSVRPQQGTAPVYSSCGIDGGNPAGCPFGAKTPEGCAGGGYAFGPDARNFTFNDVVKTSWKAGSVQNVAWGVTANHGGG